MEEEEKLQELWNMVGPVGSEDEDAQLKVVSDSNIHNVTCSNASDCVVSSISSPNNAGSCRMYGAPHLSCRSRSMGVTLTHTVNSLSLLK